MRPAGKARRPRILGIFEGGATQPGGMQRQPTAKLFRGQHTSVAVRKSRRQSGSHVHFCGQATRDGKMAAEVPAEPAPLRQAKKSSGTPTGWPALNRLPGSHVDSLLGMGYAPVAAVRAPVQPHNSCSFNQLMQRSRNGAAW
jgi:hypothetical protein